MRRLSLLLCAFLLALGFTTPAYAVGGASNVPPSALATGPSFQNISLVEKTTDNYQVYQRTWLGGPNWTPWASYGLPTPPTGFWLNGNLQTSITGPAGLEDWTILNNGKLYCVPGKSSWVQMTSQLFDGVDRDATPTVVVHADGSLRIFAIGLDPVLPLISSGYSNTAACNPAQFASWLLSGGGSQYTVGAAGTTDSDTLVMLTGENNIDATHGCFTTSPCGYLYWRYGPEGSLWNGPVTNIGGSSNVSVVEGAVGVFDGFFRCWDGTMCTTGDGTTWHDMGGGWSGGPSCIEPAAPRIDCFATDPTGVIWHAARLGPNFSDWDQFSSGTGHDLWQSLGTA